MTEKSKKLAQYINGLNGFTMVNSIDGNYENMGATIIDGILQPGIKYSTVVRPRVKQYLSDYPEVTTTTKFLSLIERKDLSKIINWKKNAKTERIKNLTNFLVSENVNTEGDFYNWLAVEQNITKLKSLSGIKDKTADYFKILTGHKTNAIDRHLLDFMKNAGVTVSEYGEAHTIISNTAKILEVDEAYLDHSIWCYMSEKTYPPPRKCLPKKWQFEL